jgi:hypothetical protein
VVAGDRPRDRAAEVVAHEVGRVAAEGVDHADDVVDEVGHGVGGRVVGAGAGGIAALVDGHRAIAPVGEGGELGRPAPRRLGEPVEQEDHRPVRGPRGAGPERVPADGELVLVDRHGRMLGAAHVGGA